MGKKKLTIFDPIYGYVRLTPVEHEIIHTPFYQRLRWIRQLGFSSYTFPGAEHSRFGHSIGVMFNAHKILESVGKAANEEELFEGNFSRPATLENQYIRLAALLHDIGTFPFSHTVEGSYIRYGEKTTRQNGKDLPDDHEHLGAFISKNTPGPEGISFVLKKYSLDPQVISDLVKGVGPNILANQILHSEVDCDRMDYLLRDAHYTGLKYGNYDRDYLLYHFSTAKVGEKEILVINHNALRSVEDFLMARFAWYSQVVRSPRGSRFDAMAEHIGIYLLERKLLFSFQDLLEFIADRPQNFYKFHDHYFMTVLHDSYWNGELDRSPQIKQMAYSLLYEKVPKTVRHEDFSQRLINQDDKNTIEKTEKKAREKYQELKEYLAKENDQKDWLLSDFPQKKIVFAKSKKNLIKDREQSNVLLERDPAKILTSEGNVELLVDLPYSVITRMENIFNYIPNVFCSESAHLKLLKGGLI